MRKQKLKWILLCMLSIIPLAFAKESYAASPPPEKIYLVQDGIINPEYAEYISGSLSVNGSCSGNSSGYNARTSFVISDYFSGAKITITAKVTKTGACFNGQKNWFGYIEVDGGRIGTMDIFETNSRTGICSYRMGDGPTTFIVGNYLVRNDGSNQRTQWDNANTVVTDIVVSFEKDMANEGDFVEFSYSGKTQTYTIPKSGLYSLEVSGGSGGNAYSTHHGDRGYGGAGGYAKGYISLKKGDTLTISIGGRGGDDITGSGDAVSLYGGSGGASSISLNSTKIVEAGGGGGGHAENRFPASENYRLVSSHYNGGNGAGSAPGAPEITYKGVTYTPELISGKNSGSGNAKITLVKDAFQLTPNTEAWTNEDVILSWPDVEQKSVSLYYENTLIDTYTGNQAAVTKNGTYTAITNEGLEASITIQNIDKRPPSLSIKTTEK